DALHFRHAVSPAAADAVLMRLGDNPAGRVWDLHTMLFRHAVGAAAHDRAAVFFRNHLAGRVAALVRGHVGYQPADVVSARVVLFVRHQLAAADGAALLARHPGALPNPVTWALDRDSHDGARFVARGA